jgi:hypothetical protein
MPNHSGLINHSQEVLRSMRRKSRANFFRYSSNEVKLKVRWVMVLVYVFGIGFSLGGLSFAVFCL